MQLKFILLNSNNTTITNAISGNQPLTNSVVLNAINGQYNSSQELPIVYIEDTKQIFVDGVFYGTSAQDISVMQSQLTTLAQGIAANTTSIAIHTNSITNINNAIGSTSDAAASDGTIYARIAKLVSDLNNEVTNRETAVSTLASTIKGYKVNNESFGDSGSITIDANEIKIGTTSTSITGITSSNTITDALIKLQTNINGVSASANAAMNEAQLHSQVTAGTGITVSKINKAVPNGAIYTVSVNDTIATKTYADTAAANNATAAYAQAISDLTGATTDAVTAITIYGARNYAKNLVDSLSSELTGADEDTLALLNRIKNEILDPNSEGEDLASTFLNKLLTVGAGFNGIDGGTAGVTGTIKNYIDASVNGVSASLSSSITTLSNAAVKKVNNVNPVNGNVTIGATNILMTNYTAATGAVASTDSVLTAVAKVEQRAISGVSAAAAAQSTANTAVINAATAQSTADTAMGLLTWVII